MHPSSADIETPLTGSILIVDDTPANLRLLSDMLAKHGYKVRTAPEGSLALASAQAIPPDLILLDIKMPDLNGYEVCEQLKANPRTQDIPIIFLSALDQIEDKVKAFTLGGVDYITKPFQVKEVSARVKTHLRLRELQAQLAERVRELEEAMAQIKTLRGLLPICANCKKVRDDQGYWQEVDLYISTHADVDVSHGICPDCFRALYPDYADILDEPGNT
jgi:PleD family two-component response regulator